MDGTQSETAQSRKVERSFEGSRLETQLMTVAYEWVMPWMRGRNGAEPADRARGEAESWSETGVAVPRRATGA